MVNFFFDIDKAIITNELECCLFLTKKENLLFFKLIKDKSVDLSKSDIIKFVWGDAKNYEDNLIQLIYRLRVKLKVIFFEDYILNVRGVGYVFDKYNKIKVGELSRSLLIINLQENNENKKKNCNVFISNNELDMIVSRFDGVSSAVDEVRAILNSITSSIDRKSC